MKASFKSKEFGIKLHGERWGRGIKNLHQLGRLFGRSSNYMGRVERGELDDIPASLFAALCVHFGLEPLEYIVLEEITNGGEHE